MARYYIPVHFDLLREASGLTDQEFGRMVRAAIRYAMGDQNYLESITGNEKFVLPFLIGQIDRNNAISDIRARAGANKREQTEAKPNKTEQKATKREKKADGNPFFDSFWDAYPRHENKTAARKAFEKLKVDEGMLNIILLAINRQKESSQWQENGGQFIPHPATWLNGRRWEDEVKQYGQTGKTVVAQQYTQNSYEKEQAEAETRWMETVREAMGK